METFRNRIKEARKLRKMSQVELAKLADIKQPTLSEIETGETKMLEAGTLVALAQALEVRPEWIMTGALPRDSSALSSDDKLLMQLINFYGMLSDSKKHELARYANFLATNGISIPSTSNPYPKTSHKPATAVHEPESKVSHK